MNQEALGRKCDFREKSVRFHERFLRARQSRAAKMIEDMTAFNVNRLNVEVRGLK